MNRNEFLSSVEAGKIAPVYLFTGKEVLLKEEALQKLRSALLPEGLEALNENVLEGASAGDIIDAAETLPVMCDRRLVVVRDFAPLLSGKARDEDNQVKRLQEWLERPADSCALIFYMREDPAGTKKLTGALKKGAVHVVFDPLESAELNQWIIEALGAKKIKISRPAAQYLGTRAGNDLTRLSGEIEKLAAYIAPRKEVTNQDVDKVVSPSIEYQVFQMVGKLEDGDLAGARKLLTSAYETGEDPIGILATLTRQFRIMAHMRLAVDAGEPAASVQKLLGVSPQQSRVLANRIRAFKADWLLKLYREAIDADFAIKNGRMRGEEALDILFYKIARRA